MRRGVLSRLVRRMLEVSQLQSRDLTRTKAPFDVCESMRRVLISMEKKITDRGLDVDADIPDSGIMVLGDNASSRRSSTTCSKMRQNSPARALRSTSA